jgi:hypothetical protein
MTRLETIRSEVIAAAKDYADAVRRSPMGSRPSDGRLVSSVWALQRYEAAVEETKAYVREYEADDRRTDRESTRHFAQAMRAELTR